MSAAMLGNVSKVKRLLESVADVDKYKNVSAWGEGWVWVGGVEGVA